MSPNFVPKMSYQKSLQLFYYILPNLNFQNTLRNWNLVPRPLFPRCRKGKQPRGVGSHNAFPNTCTFQKCLPKMSSQMPAQNRDIKWSLTIFQCSQYLAFARFARKNSTVLACSCSQNFRNCSHARILDYSKFRKS